MKNNYLFCGFYSTSLFVLLVLLPNAVLHGQHGHQAAVTVLNGKVTDAATLGPVKGATILVGEAARTVSDSEGFFQLRIDQGLPVALRVSSVGHEPLTYVAESTSVAISLQPSAENIDEVVVVGYGTQRRRDLTGAISSVPEDVLAYNLSPSVDVLLGGAVAGLNVTQASGQPGAPATIRIRGGNSVHASNDPLYVIDGFPFFSDNSSTKVGFGGIEGGLNPLNLIDPADIASIEVLKDVSATAIYGSRGSNGVILVTTKKGDGEKDDINYRYSFGAARPINQLNLLNATQWARMQKDHFLNKSGYSDEEIDLLGKGHDWQDAVLRIGQAHSHTLSFAGGGGKSQYHASGGYLAQDGVVLNSGMKRLAGRVNYARSALPGLRIGLHLAGSKSTQNTLTTFEGVNYNSSPYSAGIANSLTYALYIPPVVPIRDASGGYNYRNPFEYAYLREGEKTANPVSDLESSTARTVYSAVLASFHAEYDIAPGLRAKASLGASTSHVAQHYFSPSHTAIGLEPQGIGGIGNKRSETVLSEFTLNYGRAINGANRFDMLGGYTLQRSQTDFVTTLSSRFTNENLATANLQDGKPYGSRPVSSGAAESQLRSVLGRLNYSLLDRYHLTANFRADHSTRFAKNHKWGLFPSLGLAWNIHEEPFFTGRIPHVGYLKLRASAGNVGNQEVGDYEYLQSLEAVYYGDGVAYRVGNGGNENLKWETTAQYNIGMDVGLWKNRWTFAADAYSKKTSDLLLRIPPALGQENEQMTNVGSLANRGVELSVSGKVAERSNLSWTLSGNVAYNQNRITALAGGRDRRVLGVEVLQVGRPLGSFYGQVFEGVVQTGDDLSRLPTSPSYAPVRPGDPKLKDLNGDGHIDQNDRTVLGSKQPNLTYGLSSALKVGNFDLFALVQGTQGSSVYNQLRRYLERPNDAYNASAALLDSWTPNNPSDKVPRISSTPFSSELDSRYIENASFLRLRTLTLGYTFGRTAKLRVSLTGQNLFTVTRYKGYDPEIASGIDLGAYPMPRTFLAGLSVSY